MCDSKQYKPLVNVHIHDNFSSLDGCAHTRDYIALAKKYNHPAVCTTNHGSPSGIYDHFREVKAAGLKPILGLEFYMAQDLKVRGPSKGRELVNRDSHQLLLIKDKQGYKNYCKLTWLSFTEGYYYKPRVDYDMLFQHKQGLIATSTCMASLINQYLKYDKYQEAEELFKTFVREFGSDFYGELQFNELIDKSIWEVSQKQINDFIIDMCNKYGVKMIVTGDTHYAYPEDNELQDALIRARRSSGKEEGAEKDWTISARCLYYHSSEDYFKFNKEFGYNYDEKIVEQAMENTLEIFDKVNFEFETGKINFPKYEHIDIATNQKSSKTNIEILEDLAFSGLIEKIKQRKLKGEVFTDELIDTYTQRLEYEIDIVNQKQVIDYFLIVQDVVNWAKQNDIWVGPGRGCFVPGTKILMANGTYKNIEEIKKDDFVITHLGNHKKVLDIFEYQIEEEITELKTEINGIVLGLTNDHKVLVGKCEKEHYYRKGHNVINIDWKAASEIQKDDVVMLPKTKFRLTNLKKIDISEWIDNQEDIEKGTLVKDNTHCWYYHTEERLKTKRFIELDEDFGRLCGYFVSDGGTSIEGKTKTIFVFGIHEKEYVTDVKNLIYRYFGIQSGVIKEYPDSCFQMSFSSKILSRFFKNFCYRQKKRDSGCKHLPEKLFTSNKKFQRGFIVGMFRGDGMLRYLGIGCTSESAIRQMYTILLGQKYFPNLSKKIYKQQNLKPSWNLFIGGYQQTRLQQEYTDFESTYHRNKDWKRWWEDDRYYYFRVKTTARLNYKGPVYDIKVEDDCSFIANHVAVHNSGAGALLTYSLNITTVDPIKRKLLFERFLNPERKAMPDLDIDFAQGTRERVREYLKQKYGNESVLGVVTFGTFKPRSALQEISRGLKKDTALTSVLMREVNKLEGLDDTKNLREYFDKLFENPRLSTSVRQWISENNDTIRLADKLLGQVKNLGTHAGGILITPGPVYDHIPVTRGSGEVVTGFKEADHSTKDLSDLGLLKLDILGVKTLNVVGGCVKDIKRDLGKDIIQDIININLEDKKLIETFAKCNNVGIFQMEQSASAIIKMVKPTTFDDIVAINAINRPGPKETFGPVYGRWKKLYMSGRQEECKNDEQYPRLDFMQKATEDTFGTLLFQEQFMQMLVSAAGFNLGEADDMRRAIAWGKDHPKYHTVEKYFIRLEKGMKEQGYSQADVEYFLQYARNFMGYSYNRSHADSYAQLAMWCLYLKTYYPLYFFCNLLNIEPQEIYRDIVSDAIANNIKVLPPSITKSKYYFTVEGDAIRTGFIAIKGFADAAYTELESFDMEKCQDIYEVLAKPFRKVNSKAFQGLLDVGAFDEFGVEREKIQTIRDLNKDPKIEKWFTRKKEALTVGKMPPSLLVFPENIVLAEAEAVKDQEIPWKRLINNLIPYIKVKAINEKAREEKSEELLGFSLTSAEKLSQLVGLAEKYPELNLQSLTSWSSEDDLCYWFLINKKEALTKRGKKYLTLELSDKNSTIKAKCWDLIPVEKGKAYVSQLRKDLYGYTVVNNQFLTEIEL